MILDKLFQLMAEKQASDIFISAGVPIHIKIQGNSVPVNQQTMDPAMIEKIAFEMMSPDQQRTFEATMEMNLSFGVPNVGNFRINMFRQRASISIVVRYILGNIPPLESLMLPSTLAELIMEKRGLILIVGSTGSGKSTTIASMLDHRNANRSGHILTIEDPIEFLFRHKKSIVNQRELGMDTLGWEPALKNAMRQAFCHQMEKFVQNHEISGVRKIKRKLKEKSVAAQQIVDAGLGACLGIDLLDDHGTIETIATVFRR